MRAVRRAVKFFETFLITRRYKKAYNNLQQSAIDFDKTRKALDKYQARYQRDGLGNLPECIDESFKHMEAALRILYLHRPIKNLNDALERIKELAILERAEQEKRTD